MAKVFFLEPTHRQRQYLRRYRSGEHLHNGILHT